MPRAEGGSVQKKPRDAALKRHSIRSSHVHTNMKAGLIGFRPYRCLNLSRNLNTNIPMMALASAEMAT